MTTRPFLQITLLLLLLLIVLLLSSVDSLSTGILSNTILMTSFGTTLRNSTIFGRTMNTTTTNNDDDDDEIVEEEDSVPPRTMPPKGQNLEVLSQQQVLPTPMDHHHHHHHHVCIMVEPSPLTYISGYANRFQQLLLYLHTVSSSYKVNVITTEVVAVANPLPTTFGNTTTKTTTTTTTTSPIPIHYCTGIRLPFYPTMSVISPYVWKNNLGAILRRIHRPQQPPTSNRIDLLHVSSPGFMIFYAIFYSRYYSIPLLMSYHTHLPIYIQSYIPNRIISPILQWIAWKMIRMVHSFADLTVVTSPQVYDEFVHQHHVPRCSVWQKGIDTITFHPNNRNTRMRRRMMGLDDEYRKNKNNGNHNEDNLFLLVYIGRLGIEKRLKDLRDMLDRLSEHYTRTGSDLFSQIRLCLVGDGPQRSILEQYFQKYIQEGIVTFTGVLRGTDLSQAYASSDLFILPSDSETLGFVVMESMASGVPVIGVKAGGVPDLIEHNQTGFLVDQVGDISTFVTYILQLKDNVCLRNDMAKKSRIEMERWSWTTSMTKLVNEQYTEARNNFSHRLEQRIIRLWRRCSSYCSWNAKCHDVPVILST